MSRSQTPDRTPDEPAGKRRGGSPAKPTGGSPTAPSRTPAKAAGGKAAAGRGAAGPGGPGRPGPRGRHRLSAAERAAAQRRKRLRIIVVTAVSVLVVGSVAGLLVQRNVSRGAARSELNVQSFADQGRTHLDAGGKYSNYNSTPPTSGPHDPNSAPCGVSSGPIPNEVQVHDLEHGVVMLQYRPGLDGAQVQTLERIARSYDSHVIVAPYPGLNTAVAATAWTKLMTLDRVDSGKIRSFVDLYRQRGPEAGVPCPIG
ncbi:MAG TPA: DUF3105 domain-containing protein [Actinomycetes bacterium]|nr:DUF3105 domain-containing protein [Actinomycetes bacterium]